MDRQFGERFELHRPLCEHQPRNDDGIVQLCAYVRGQVVGMDNTFKSPFGTRKVFYCDHTASSRSLHCIESYIISEVLPFYANSHSSATVTAEQSTLYLHEARSTIRNSVHASEHDAVLFTGAGCTSAVHLLVNAIKRDNRQKIVVFLGPHEHHSNMLPWRELADQVNCVAETESGQVDIADLEKQLKRYNNTDGVQLIGCFSAASNVTGVLADTDSISMMLHRYNALAFWDYACAAPYVTIHMNPTHSSLAHKDAVYFSGHKILGAPSSPGVLIAKKRLFRNAVPLRPGGGTVFFVENESHSYLREIEYREEGGTPDIVGAVRLALAVRLQNTITTRAIQQIDKQLLSHFLNRLRTKQWCSDCVLVFGPDPSVTDRLPIISFLIRHPSTGLFLHHNFVTVLLNDLFGVQTRSGCMCAGPYAQRLLGIDQPLAKRYDAILQEHSGLDRTHLRRVGEYSDYEMLRPGFTRLNLMYYMEQQDVDYLCDAVLFVAEHGWKFLPMYILNRESGEWHHRDARVFTDRKWLSNVLFTHQGLKLLKMPDAQRNTDGRTCLNNYQCLDEAKLLAEGCAHFARRHPPLDDGLLLDEHMNSLRWFMLSCEAHSLLTRSQPPTTDCQPPFTPRTYIVNSNSNHSAETPTKAVVVDAMSNGHSVVDDDEPECHVVTLSESPIAEGNCAQPDSDQEMLLSSNTTSSIEFCVPCTYPSTSTASAAVGVQRQNWTERVIVERDPNISEKMQLEKWMAPPKQILKLTLQAISDYSMLRDGDRVLVCLSGGKDSLSLLHTMRQVQRISASANKIQFELGAVTVDPLSSAYDPSPLIDYLKGLNTDYLYEQQDIVGKAASLGASCASICAFCSRMKRGRLYAAARKHKWNVLAFGQHLDDLAESFLMNAFQNGALRTMKAHYSVKQNDLRVIRPFVYVREKQLRVFAESSGLPIIPENCPACFEQPKERHRIKQLLASQELHNRVAFPSLRSALKPLMAAARGQTANNILHARNREKEDNYDESE